MNVNLAYLDSSSIVKRYIEEEGSQIVDAIYEKAEVEKLRFIFNLECWRGSWRIRQASFKRVTFRSRF